MGMLKGGDLVSGANALKEYMFANPDDTEGWHVFITFCIETEATAWAYPVAVSLVNRKPEDYRSHYLYASILAVLQKADKSLAAFDKALELMPEDVRPSTRAQVLRLYANALVQGGDYDKSLEYAEKSLELADHPQAHVAIAYAELNKRNWERGWKEYDYQLGTADTRPKHSYGLPEWKGEKDARVIYYGDQGLGDQLAYMSAATNAVEINCNEKLKNLMQRSFPDAVVHGEQTAETVSFTPVADFEVSMAQAMNYQTVERRGRYLVPHPHKSVMAKALLDSYGDKPKIGIAWTGGKVGSDGWRGRNLTFAQLEPILELPYTFVSLEYSEPEESDPRVLEFPYFTRTNDLDDVAALVDQLDAVISVPTTAYHVCGGLGVPCAVLVHDNPHFHEGVKGDSPWWGSVQFFRRPEMGTEGAINAAAEWLEDMFTAKRIILND